MKLDRNLPDNKGLGKYIIINLRRVHKIEGAIGPPKVNEAINTLDQAGVLDWGTLGEEDEFFVIKLKDQNARAALRAYAEKAAAIDPEWAQEVLELADRAGECSPYCKAPD